MLRAYSCLVAGVGASAGAEVDGVVALGLDGVGVDVGVQLISDATSKITTTMVNPFLTATSLCPEEPFLPTNLQPRLSANRNYYSLCH